MNRPERDDVFMGIVSLLSQRASCQRLHVGALIVMEGKHIIASGVNGPNTWTCTELKCDIEKPCQHAIHAEQNAIRFARRHGVDLKGATLYCTHQPCIECAKMIVAEGILRVVYKEPYRLREGLLFLQTFNVEVLQYESKPTKDS